MKPTIGGGCFPEVIVFVSFHFSMFRCYPWGFASLSTLDLQGSTSRRQMQRCFLMHNFIDDSEINSMITRGLDCHSHNTCSKETIRSIRSNTNWGLRRSFNSALTDWNSLPEDMRCLPFDDFKISLLKNFKSQLVFS